MAENFNFSDNIRDSFGKVYQQAVPKALQGQLFARLEQEGLMSEKADAAAPDNSIKTAFEGTFIAPAPAFVWNHIESDLSENTDSHFQESIKNSFTQGHQSAVPIDFWGAISEQISTTGTPSESLEKQDDNLIKDSFEEKYGKTAPDYIWNAVREQINIDKVWEHIVQVLDRMQRRELWQARLRRWMSYAALLMFMHACLPTHYLGIGLDEQLPGEPLVNLPEILTKKERIQNTTKAVISNPVEIKEEIKRKQIQTKAPLTAIVTKDPIKTEVPAIIADKVDEPSETKEPLTAIVTKDPIKTEVPAIIADKVDEPSEMKEPLTAIVTKDPIKTEVPVIIADKVDEPSETKEPLTAIVTKDPIKTEVPAIIADKVDEPSLEKEIIVDVNLSDQTLEAISLNEISIAPKLKLDSSILELALTMPIKKRKRIEEEDLHFKNSIGLIASSGVGLAFNEETKLGFDATSLVSTGVAPALSLGFAGTYAFSHKSALSYELYANSQIKQELHYYSKAGRYNQQKQELNYVRLSAMYQHRLLRYGRSSGVESAVLGKVGGYAAYLTAERAFENEVLTTSTSNYRKMDFGLQLMLGQRHRLNRIVLEYGVVGNLGLYNIFNGPSSLANLAVQNTRLLHAGGYLSLQYLF
jgi:hypothetical protein